MNYPKHVAVILDGNGRWATKRGLNRSLGHKAGSDNLNKLAVHALKNGVKVLTVFAFSTENFKRDKKEVDYLMNLFKTSFNQNKNYFNKNNIKVVFSGREYPLDESVLKVMSELSSLTENNTGGVFNICLNYGGQSEIVDTTKKIIKKVLNNELKLSDIDEDLFARNLYNDLPSIDLLIRTSGEIRISNFTLYNMAYAELVFTDTLFPDFNEEEFDKVVGEYNLRNRRFGGNSK